MLRIDNNHFRRELQYEAQNFFETRDIDCNNITIECSEDVLSTTLILLMKVYFPIIGNFATSIRIDPIIFYQSSAHMQQFKNIFFEKLYEILEKYRESYQIRTTFDNKPMWHQEEKQEYLIKIPVFNESI